MLAGTRASRLGWSTVSLLLALTVDVSGTGDIPAVQWMREGNWNAGQDAARDMASDRAEFCHGKGGGGCLRDIATPHAAISAMVPYIRDRVVCDIGSRKGDMMMEFKPYARRVIGIEIDRDFAQQAIARGLEVHIGDLYKMKLPACNVFYFWIYSKMAAGFVQRMADYGFTAPVWVVLGGEVSYSEGSELARLKQVQKRHGGVLIKVPFDEGTGYRQFGVFCMLIAEAGRGASRTPRLPSGTQPLSVDTEYLASQKGWVFASATTTRNSTARARLCGGQVWGCVGRSWRYRLNTPTTSVVALRSMVVGKVLCIHGASEPELESDLASHAREVIGANATGDSFNRCDVVYSSAYSSYMSLPEKVQEQAATTGRAIQLILGVDWQDTTRAPLLRLLGQYGARLRPRVVKVPFDEGNGRRQFGVYCLVVFELPATKSTV
eukprot:NODE_1790_length_1406_cov_36.540899_g1619_i0.p1 GENE.NODE_1790_length_1406_cov_36.540899_g1619_i0~~NODE_1790_length_1406_cov_36.540899_g1619_i0.p1  ORF type:complete len:436 (+),score=54.20 NODE_1790_length_1406_cov_36.540899_g1619_i0:83-1390(+)